MEDRGKASLERRYRRWLRLYPREYRSRRGEEILQTLLELSRPGQRRPSPREVTAMVLQGLRVRAGTAQDVASPRRWLAAFPLAACLLLVFSLAQTVLVVPALVDVGAARTAGDVALLTWQPLAAALVLALVYRRAYRAAVLLAVLPALVNVVLKIRADALGELPGNHVAILAMDLGNQLVPALLLLPLLLPSGEPPALRRWQLGVPAVLCAPVLGLAIVQRLPESFADDGVLWSLMPVMVVLALLGVLVWGALVDGCVALAVSLCSLIIAGSVLGNAGAAGIPLPWGSFVIIGGVGLVLAGAGAYRTHRQALA